MSDRYDPAAFKARIDLTLEQFVAAPDTAESLKVIRYKTAKYTVEQPLLIGGAAGHPRRPP